MSFRYGWPKRYRVDIPPGEFFTFVNPPWESWVGTIPTTEQVGTIGSQKPPVALSSHHYPQRPGLYFIEPNGAICQY